jgi:transposase
MSDGNELKRFQQKIIALENKMKFLEEENLFLRDKVNELEKKLAQYENPHVPPSLDKRKRPPKNKNPGKPGQKKGHKGTTRPQPEPTEHIDSKLKSCPDCGKSLGKPINIERNIIEEIPEPMPVKVIEYITNHYHCKNCNKDFTATHTDKPDEGRFGKNVLAQTSLMKFEDRLPHRKIQAALKRQYGLDVSIGAIFDFTRRVQEKLEPVYSLILNRIRRSKITYVDETSIKVNGKKYWLWVFVMESDTFIVIRKSRGMKVLIEILTRKYRGIIVCDGWKSYPNFTSRIQRCWAHLLRELEHLAEHVEEAIHLDRSMHKLYNKLVKFVEKEPPPELRKRKWYEARATMRRWLDREYDDPSVKKIIEKMRNGFDHWFTFIINPGVEPTNNRAERALRESVVQRKIIGTLRNEKGTHIFEVLMSVFATWKQQGKNLLNSLISVI